MSEDAGQLLESVRLSGLVSVADLASASRQIQQDSTLSSREVMAGLLERRALTEFQAEQILTGHGDECILAGRFRLLELLGAGAMGTVYKAADTKLGRNVAVKVLPAKSVTDPDAVARFQREAMALAKLTHANIVQAFDSGEDRGKHFLVMECVEGTSVAQMLRERGKIPPTRAADCAYQAALGLAHAHGRGLIHRDLKPSNLLVTTAGQLKILDLGLARFLSDQIGDATLTRDGIGLGTPDYMPPEQYLNARHADGRSDIYALGCTLYHMIAGEVPFPGSSMTEKYAAHESKEPPPLEVACPEVPAGLAMAIRRMMAKRPADRFQSAREVAEALAPYVAGSSSAIVDIQSTAHWEGSRLGWSGASPRARRRRRAIGSVVGVAALVAVVLAIWGMLTSRPDTTLASSGGAGGASGTPSATPPAEEPPEEPPRQPEPSPPNVLTVSQDGSGQYRTIAAALAKAKPGMTIRVLDDATYGEDIALSSPTAYAGITLESPRRATIEGPGLATIHIQDVPRVRVSGFRIRPKGAAAILVTGGVYGMVLHDLELDGNAPPIPVVSAAASSRFGIAAQWVDIADDQPPLVIENCAIRRFTGGVRVSGIGDDYKSPQAAGRIVVRNNTFEDCPGGIFLTGLVRQAQVVGNRISGATMTALQLEALIDGAGDILIANNTVFDSKCAFRLWDEAVRGKNVQFANNLVVGRADEPDMTFIDSGGNQQIQRGPGDGRLVHDAWRWSHNWREVREPVGEDQASKSWIPPGASDVVRTEITGLSRDAESPDFLRPAADSEMASGGAGQEDPTLPDYVGAVPPEGVESWDWQQTWDGRHPKMVLTVSEKPEDGGDFRSIGEALDKVVRADMTIRVLDDATYEGAIQISSRARQEGLTLDSPRRATLAANGANAVATIINVPRVTLRGFRVQARGRQFCMIAGGISPGLLVDQVGLFGDPSAQTLGVSFEQAPLAPGDAPMVVRNCTFADLSAAVQMLGLNGEAPSRCSNIVLRGNSIHNCGVGIQIGGHVTHLLAVGNRIWDCQFAALGRFDLRAGSGRIVIANNTMRGPQNCIAMREPIGPGTEVEIANNLILCERAPDIAFDGADRTAIAGWRIHQNVRQAPAPAESDPSFAKWVPPTADTLVPSVPLVSDDPASNDFLRPSGELPAGDAAGGDLPDYVGALPPEGDDTWDWDLTWAKLHEREREEEEAE